MNSKQPIIWLTSSISFPFYALLIIFLVTLATISATFGGGNDTDHQALLNIKSMITDHGALTSWNTSTHFCEWSGVTCGKRHRRVTYIVLRSQGLEGSLSPYVGNLSFLRYLAFTNNSLQGTIPQELGRLSRLRFLYLGSNKFSGVIPNNISSCLNLEAIGLANNELVGSIPKEISFLSKLTLLNLQVNKLTGGIPPLLGNITSMELFTVAKNPLGGGIPDTLGNWKNITEIYCGIANLSGTIPESFYNLSFLKIINMPDNQLTGSLHPSIGAMFPQLVVLQLWGNHLSGSIPPSISNCSNLETLEMNNNKFTGKLRIDFTKTREINFILLSNNFFGSNEADEMKFIDSLQNCTKLTTLAISNCMFQGVFPRSIANLSNQLQYLSLQSNQLHGNLPESIGNLVGLEMLALFDNQFTGEIPTTIGNLRNLRSLYLQQNQLSGAIPYAIGNLSLLITLYLYSNKLQGVIPSSLGNCSYLLELYLNDNKFSGGIPKNLPQLSSLSKSLDLSQNNLSGSLPIEVGDLKMLSTLDLSGNNLSGNIPSSLSGCASLSTLSLKTNSFQGMIPPSLVSLKGLVNLDVSQNNLSGQIPKFLERLQLLNLSYNDFEGEVPILGVFANVTSFSVLGNSRLCGGIVELGLPKCNETKKHEKKFPLFVIIILVASTIFTITCFSYAWWKKKSKSQSSQSLMKDELMKVSYNQLLKATDGFCEANLIGNGGFSSVYKGILDEDNDRVVAIKVLHLQNQGAQRSFVRECEALRSIRHRNLLKIITSCSSIDFQGNDFKALVYEFMPKGSLHDWLHSSESTSRLTLVLITNILMDVASALDYIHNHCVPPMVHGDLKPCNILLDDDMVAHVGDFGLARFLGTSYTNNSTGIRGTIGYVAPEYGLGNEMTTSGDVYSFGILLLEAMTGKKPTDDIFNEGHSLHELSSKALPDNIMDIVDANILNAFQEGENFIHNNEENRKKIEECLTSTFKIGVSCTVDCPQERMNMKSIVHELQHILDKLKSI